MDGVSQAMLRDTRRHKHSYVFRLTPQELRLAEYWVMPVLNQVQDVRHPSGEGMDPESSSG